MMKKKIIVASIAIVVIAALGYIVCSRSSLCNGLGGKEYSGIVIKEIRTIAEWIGSEYHGEVLMSLQECEEDKRRNECRQLYAQCKTDSSEVFWTSVSKDSNWVLMKKAAQIDSSAFHSFINENTFADFQQQFNDFEKELSLAAADDLDNLDLVYLARGRVTAGYDFSQLKKRNIELVGDTLKVYDMQLRILDTIINPWFDADKKLEGYELVRVTSERKINPRHQDRVKSACVAKLKKAAIDKGIFKYAENSIREYVLGIAQMLLPDQDITVVQFFKAEKRDLSRQ